MSLDYDLEISTSIEPREILIFLVETLGFNWCNDDCLKSNGIVLGVRQKNEDAHPALKLENKSQPVLKVWFQLNKFEGHDEGKYSLYRVTEALLLRTQADAILLFDNDIIILQYINGKLIVNSDWNPSLTLGTILPYEIRSLGA